MATINNNPSFGFDFIIWSIKLEGQITTCNFWIKFFLYHQTNPAENTENKKKQTFPKVFYVKKTGTFQIALYKWSRWSTKSHIQLTPHDHQHCAQVWHIWTEETYLHVINWSPYIRWLMKIRKNWVISDIEHLLEQFLCVLIDAR
jgi:hypothetical protein